jgi:SIT4-associating protein SAP185/190
LDTTLSNTDDLLVPFWDAVLTAHPVSNQPSLPHHMHPLFNSSPVEPSSPRLNVTNLPTVPGENRDDAEDSDVGVLGLELKRQEGKRVTSARDNGPGKSVLAGYWAKVNGVFLDKKPKEVSTI